ncbi:MAG: sialate O-acetylesterase [Akkermansiaceae bacterium]
MRRLNTCMVTAIALACSIFTSSFAAPSAEKEGPRPLAVQLGAPFHDHAVLQRGMTVPVWGWSKPGTQVTVEFGGQKAAATAADDGKWMAELKELKASFEPSELVISEAGGKTETLTDILVGEVWMASGQSNMQWMVGKSKVKTLAEEFATANEGKVVPIREFQVSSVTSQLHPIKKATGAWKNGDYANYSAIAFAFAHRVYEEVKVPVGILNCSFSQTAIQAWVPREGWATAEDAYSKAIHMTCLQTDPTTPEHKEAWGAFYKSLEDQIASNEAAIEAGTEAKEITAPLPGNLKSNRDASWLFNGRLSPVVPYAIRGAIWNQGYANMGEGLPYYNNLHNLVRGWRIVWDRPELPVYFHQFYSAGMKNAGKEENKPSIASSAEMRLGTFLARDIPNTGMASQIDISGAIHYQAKAVPGQRLALHALKNHYGKKDLVTDGPMFKSYKVDGDKLVIEFDHADGGLVVAGTAYNAVGRHEDSTGYANPKIIPNGDDQVKLFFVAGEDRVWHPASMKIEGEKVIVSSPAVKKPLGVSYGTGEIGWQPNLYNKSLLPTTPFIYFDQKMVTSHDWPDEKLKVAGETIDPNTVGKVYEYRKMPLLSTQFRDDAVFQADQPVTIWGSTRNFGEWQTEPEEGDCKVHFEFGDIKKVLDVNPESAEWKVTLPPMKAGSKTHTLKVQFSIDGEMVHERIVKGIVFGDVWCVVAPGGKFELPEVKDSGQIVRMIENESKRDGKADPSRFSICVSRTPRVVGPDGKASNRFASYWKDAEGLAAALGHQLAAKSGRPTGIIFLGGKKDVPIKNWIAPSFLKEAPSLMEDYKSIGSKYPDNPYYLENVRRYIGDWKGYWSEYVPMVMKSKSVPEDSPWGSNWGSYPTSKPELGDSTATFNYNIYVHSFAPVALSGVVFLAGEAMVSEDQGKNFGSEMAALVESFKSRLSLWHDGTDVPFFYTVPSKSLVPNVTKPEGIEGKSTAVEIGSWPELKGVFENVLK